MSFRVNGSPKDLYFPARETWTPIPYFSNIPAKNMGSLAKPGIKIRP